jgi:hypothetical protein
MKTTMMFRTIANPRRTTLAHFTAAGELHLVREQQQPEHAVVLPAQTANPRRTMLVTAPEAFAAEAGSDALAAVEAELPAGAAAAPVSSEGGCAAR